VNRLFADRKVEIWMKAERQNPGGSIKDRIGLAMIEAAEAAGILKEGSVIVEPTSGNTGIGLALVAATKGYRCILTMPESMSVERRSLMAAYGAEVVLTPKEKGIKGAVEKAEAICLELGGKGWIPMQFNNPANVAAHYEKTAEEILADFPEGFDYLITGVGTGGHFSGVAKKLKEKFPNLKAFAVEPIKSPVLSGGSPGPHRIQGIGAGFIPANMDVSLADGFITVTEEAAFEMAQRCSREEGIFVGISSGATLAGVKAKLPDIPDGARVIIFSYDTGERYLSIPDFVAPVEATAATQ